MDQNDLTRIGLRFHTYAVPCAEKTLIPILERLGIAPGTRSVEVACGIFTVSKVLNDLYGTRSLLISPSGTCSPPPGWPETIPTTHYVTDPLDWFSQPANRSLFTAPGVGIGLGSSPLFGGFPAEIVAFTRVLPPGSLLILAEPFWQQPPSPGFLHAYRHLTPDSYFSHSEHIAIGEEAGCTPLYSITIGMDDRDAFEGLFALSLQSYCNEQAQDPNRSQILEAMRERRDAYLTWGRDTLGMGFYLFQT